MCFHVRPCLERWHRYMWLRVRPCLRHRHRINSCKTLSGTGASI
ncbi:Ankyrin repeat domain-containing 34B [Gossypium arboreum]|uniref:Ankyrin repeat domain-containing 34B n=1 Tax=Gossypium arboreum TaxID=29729 RepID=A0A0B0MV40_GOSAR|nr:Ankyrin repeat domain-containing 34B [Gossypium arboreum]KHG16803.1 Ankyrin repeat domain-containing 34B [Gossypium arboreum]